MENYAYSSYPESGDSSPRSREVESDNGSTHHPAASSWAASDDVPPAAAAAVVGRVKLMISYGGRIQPRPHDNQLSYLNGETKILSVDRSMRFLDFHSKLASIANVDEVCIKYQLPGEDLDALISVTNDEDLEHMILEFDRLHLHRSSNSSRSTPRLRVFLFPINPPPPSPALLEPKQERHWFLDALNSIPPLPPPVPVSAPASNGHASPDYLFGLDNGFVPPPAVKVKDPTPPDQPIARDSAAATVEIPVKEDRQIGSDPSPVASPPEIQRQIQELEKLQVADNQPQSLPQAQTPTQSLTQPPSQPQAVPPAMPRTGSEETLARAFVPKPQEKPPVPAPVQSVQQMSPQAPPATAVPQPTVTAPTGYIPRFQSIAGGDHHPVYVISHAPHGYYAAAPPGTTSFVYAMAPPAPNHSANGGAAGGGGDMNAGYGAGHVPAGYDNAGRAVYYTSVVPTAYHHQAVTSVALTSTEAPKPVKPSQVS
ncbi:Octicosapeptide/Phox/Bem1p family protein [Rhynchospora pubera]|uniref:Octicosapeptide/Phox/Bem1p family protein n=1 Tax=Rhynchospora pubera TaxID=906938 RepID=A0AAV8E386_9POAL|nr:Octicosapeptide/Phox/Bem1p family protein [Rhynchospora pubera]